MSKSDKFFIKYIIVSIVLAVFILLVFTLEESYSAHKFPEKHYQGIWCSEHNGELEVILPDKARIDCLTNEYAIEFDFAKKWAESIGQALYYSSVTGKRAGIVLILENPDGDQKYIDRIEKIKKEKKLDITIWTMK